mmetsp:Transcript_32346/g.103141  ORF Transcript_32346/g.103141 Transcript_32346/m.103141 type:complete len:111 (-) Transcript_32346:142-474(-)
MAENGFVSRAYAVSYPWVQTNIQPFMRALDWSRLGLMASAATAVAPLLVACVASAERLDQLGPNGGVFLSGQLELRQALDLPGFRGLNASSLARSLWRDTESLLAALPEK